MPQPQPHQPLALFIQHSAFSGVYQERALSFLQAWLKENKPVARVFFYQDGVLTANIGLQNNQSVANQFIALSIEHKFPLQVCIASANRRGIIDEAQAKKQNTRSTLNKAFELVGLGELAEAGLNNEKIVSF